MGWKPSNIAAVFEELNELLLFLIAAPAILVGLWLSLFLGVGAMGSVLAGAFTLAAIVVSLGFSFVYWVLWALESFLLAAAICGALALFGDHWWERGGAWLGAAVGLAIAVPLSVLRAKATVAARSHR